MATNHEVGSSNLSGRATSRFVSFLKDLKKQAPEGACFDFG